MGQSSGAASNASKIDMSATQVMRGFGSFQTSSNDVIRNDREAPSDQKNWGAKTSVDMSNGPPTMIHLSKPSVPLGFEQEQEMKPTRQVKKWKVRARQGVVITKISETTTSATPCKRGFEETESTHIEKMKTRKFSTCSSQKVGQANLEWPQPSP
ncbi:conserved hypothetical protein [Ricinus communis]|uniref:Uncharacterized protein n=1 Tax=Ricinus communis TaxID=3988 RepID=B9S2Y7_RICCO|nr:conserved hypothetical protein [Ricinus communis]